MKLKENFPELLKELIKEKSMTTSELARKARVTERFIHYLKKGKNKPSFNTLIQIGVGLNMKSEDTIARFTYGIDS